MKLKLVDVFGISEDHGDSIETESPSHDHITLLTKALPFNVAEVNGAFRFVDFWNVFVTRHHTGYIVFL